MGLAIGVGMLAEWAGENPEGIESIRSDLRGINEHLESRGLPQFEEPTSFEDMPESRATLASFPYSWLHYLRRFAAHVMRDPKWVPYPVEPGEDPAQDIVLRQMYRAMSSHLLCHSDCEGYYLPIDFKSIVFDATEKVRGGTVGSSYRLKEELELLCDPLEIPYEQGVLDDTAAHWLSEQRPTGAPFAIERLVWFALYEAARLSIEYNTAIVFY